MQKKLLELPENLIFVNRVTFGLNIPKFPFSFKEL